MSLTVNKMVCDTMKARKRALTICQVSIPDSVELSGEMVIGKGVVIGDDCIIPDSVEIGMGATIGNKCIITDNLPANIKLPSKSKPVDMFHTVYKNVGLYGWTSYGETFYQIANTVMPKQEWSVYCNTTHPTSAAGERDHLFTVSMLKYLERVYGQRNDLVNAFTNITLGDETFDFVDKVAMVKGCMDKGIKYSATNKKLDDVTIAVGATVGGFISSGMVIPNMEITLSTRVISDGVLYALYSDRTGKQYLQIGNVTRPFTEAIVAVTEEVAGRGKLRKQRGIKKIKHAHAGNAREETK